MASCETANRERELPLLSNTRKSRLGMPKVRSGCSTCKQRRIKCDEQKPVCSRCQKSLRKCGFEDRGISVSSRNGTFVPIRPRISSEDRIPARPENLTAAVNSSETESAISADHVSGISTNPSIMFLNSETERRYFDHLRHRVGGDLCGYFNNSFWNRIVFQECHTEPAIKHEILALGAIFMSMESSESGGEESHRKAAFMQQSKAMKLLRQRMSKGPFPLRLALIANLVLTNIESLHGDLETALQQTSSGLKLIKIWQAAKSKRNQDNAALELPSSIEPEILSILPQLELQMMTYLVMNAGSDKRFIVEQTNHQEFLPENFDSMPDAFDSLQEALPYAVKISIRILSYLRKCNWVKAKSPVIFSPWFAQEQSTLLKACYRWTEAYEPIYQLQRPGFTKMQVLSSLMFDINCRLYQIILNTGSDLEETVFDGFNDEFEAVVVHSGHLLRQYEEIKNVENTLKIHVTVELVMCLYYVATRCRDGSIRRAAISILRDYPAMNAVWNSAHAVCVAEWALKIEEEGCDEKGFIPEESRIRTCTLKWEVSNGYLNMECVQGSMVNGSGKLRHHKVPSAQFRNRLRHTHW